MRLQTGDRDYPLLATFEQYADRDPVFPIFRSDDEGHSGCRIGAVRDTEHGWGLRYQPFLYELESSIGGFAAGTILCAGNAIPGDLSRTSIDLYASHDRGRSWTFVSTVASGGKALPDNGLTPVWEPFLLLHDGRLVCFYSDQRDPEHGQKLVHQTSTDLRTWGPVVDDVTSSEYGDRPGMPTVAALPDGRWILTYEAGCDGDGDAFFALQYRLAEDPEQFGVSRTVALRDDSGAAPESSAPVVWMPGGSEDGTIVVSAASNADLYVNRHLGAPEMWRRIRSAVPAGYTRFLSPLGDGRAFTISGGPIGNLGHDVVVGAIDVIA